MTLARFTRFCLLASSAALAATAARADGELWTVDFEAAKKTASADGKDIMMEFTGSDWCPPCMAFAKEVLSKEAFQTEAPKHFVLLKLDNPNDKSKQSKEEQEQYQKLSTEFKVEGVPTVILADASGRPYAKIVGYGGTAAEDYVKDLVSKTDLRKQRDEFFTQAGSAEGAEKAKLLAKAIEGIDAELAISTYRETIDEIIKLDVDNASGLKGKFENLLKLEDVKRQLQEIQVAAQSDAEGALKKLDALISDAKLEGVLLQETLFVKGAILYASDKPASKAALEAALAADPNSDKAAQLKQIIAQAFKDVAAEEKEEGEDQE